MIGHFTVDLLPHGTTHQFGGGDAITHDSLFSAPPTNTHTQIDTHIAATSAHGANGDIAGKGDNLSVFAATSSAQLAGVISDETGSGLLVFGTNPTLVTPRIISFANATHDHSNAAGGGSVSAEGVSIATGAGSPTVDQVQEYLDNTGSSGFFLGGELSDGGSGTLDVAAGSGFIRTTDDDNAELQSFKWSASAGIAVTDDTTQYVYVDEVGTISLSTNEFLEASDKIQIGVVTDEGGAVSHVFSLGVRLQESIGAAGRFIRRVHGISRNNRLGGLIFGQSGDVNRDLTITAGQLEWGRTSYVINSFNTSGADTFATYSASGQEDATASQWPNEQYDNVGTLTNMTVNKWVNLFFFIEPDGHIIMIYGREQFVSEALANNEGVPSSSLPSRVSETSILAARFTFQKSSNTATISSAFDALFANAAVTDHGNLAGLSDDDHTQYLLADGSRALAGAWNMGSQALTNVNIDSGIIAGITGMDFLLDADDNITIDGRTNPRTITIGTMRSNHTAGIAGTRAYHVDVESAGFDDTTGIVIRHNLLGSSANIRPKCLQLDADITGATNAHVNCMEVAKTGDLGSGMRVDALDVRPGITVIHHHSGTFGVADQNYTFTPSTYTDVDTAFNTADGGGANDVELFGANNDYVYIGHSAKFGTIEVILYSVADSPGVKPTFEYSTGVGTWDTLPISDGTNGFRENGNIVFSKPSDWTSEDVNSVTKFWVRIQRTANTVTAPVESTVKVSVDVEYEWDADGDVNVKSVDLASGNAYSINSTSVLSATTLGGAVVNASLRSITPGANFTLNQNSAAVITSEETSAVARTLYLKQGFMGLSVIPTHKLDIKDGSLNVDASDGTRDDSFVAFVYNREETDGRSHGLWIQAGSTSGDDALKVVDHDNANILFQVAGSGVVKMASYANGTMSFTGGDGTVTTSSDRNLKTNIANLANGLEKVLALNPIYFDWKDTDKYGANRQLGFTAQDVYAVCPSTGVKTIKGEDKKELWGIYDRGLIAMCVKAIQELKAELDAFKANAGSGMVTIK